MIMLQAGQLENRASTPDRQLHCLLCSGYEGGLLAGCEVAGHDTDSNLNLVPRLRLCRAATPCPYATRWCGASAGIETASHVQVMIAKQ